MDAFEKCDTNASTKEFAFRDDHLYRHPSKYSMLSKLILSIRDPMAIQLQSVGEIHLQESEDMRAYTSRLPSL